MRYIVVVYFHDHWGVNVDTDDLTVAVRASVGARGKGHKAIVVDTENQNIVKTDEEGYILT